MTTFSWKAATTGDWSTSSSWTPSGPPNGTTADAVIGVSGTYTVTLGAASSYSVNTLTVDRSTARLKLLGTLKLGGTAATLTLQSGTIVASGSIQGGTVAVAGGVFEVANNISFAGTFKHTAGTIVLDPGRTLSLSGPTGIGRVGPFSQGTITGAGTLSTSGTTTLVTDDRTVFNVDNGATWSNAGTALVGGGISAGAGVSRTAAFVNKAGAIFNLTTDDAGISKAGTSSTSTFSNAGLLEKTGGAGLSEIDSTVTNAATGRILVNTGTLQFNGGGAFGGTLSGTGTIVFGGGIGVLSGIASGAKIQVTGGSLQMTSTVLANLTVAGGTFQASANIQVSGAAAITVGTIVLDSGRTLSLSGPTGIGRVGPFAQGTITGAGTLSTSGTTTLVTDDRTLFNVDNGATWSNAGTALVGGGISAGAGVSRTAVFVNKAGAVFNLISDNAGINNAFTSSSTTLSNAGTLQKTGGTGLSQIDSTVTNTGSIAVATGTLALPTLTNLSGTILTGGSYSVSSGATLQLANNVRIATLAASVTLSGSTSAINSLNTAANPNVQVGILSTLATVTSAGALRLVGGRSFTAVANSGTFTLAGKLQLGGGTFDATKLNVASTTTILGYGVVKPAVGATALLNAAGGGTLALLGTVGTAAALQADANSVLQLNQTAITTVSGKITLNGVGSKIQVGTTSFTQLESTLTTIATTGNLSVLGGRGYVTTKSLSDSGILTVAGGTITAASITVASTGRIVGFGTFTNAIASTGTIESSSGLLKLNAGASGTGALLVDAGSTLELAASTSVGKITANGVLKLDGQTYVASTTVGATGLVQGFGTINSSITDNGVIDAKGGLLKIAGSVSGTGGLRIENASTLELGAAASRAVTFATGAVGTLQLDAQASFTGAINGLALGDAINFKNQTVSSAVVSGTTLTVVGSQGTVRYQVAGALTGNHFAVQADQHTIKLVTGALALAPATFLASAVTASEPAENFATASARPAPVAVVASATLPDTVPAGPGIWAYQPSAAQALMLHH